jgi:hypothetical protein
LILAGVALLALWFVVGAARRRSERRADEARARAQARRPRVPVVSSNLRGQSAASQDLWREAARAAERAEAAPPAAAPPPER